ncbi:MAG: hypothetical protein CVU84_04630 [Firmicutes bacterium HGW-Firmicutes-1]|nr:MAG: hypothetical protein CVU84_04630 [Firmicutes bacterium HGW-Firmicutes-1]
MIIIEGSKNLFQKNLKYYILYGIVFELITNLYKPFSVKFLERIGGSDFDISLFNALPGLIMLFTLIPGILLLRNLNIKKTTGLMVVLSRIFILLYAFVPFFPIAYQPFAFTMITALMSAPTAIYLTGFQSLTGDLFEPDEWVKAVSVKSKYSVLMIIFITLLTGQLLTVLPQNDNQRILLYQGFFLLAFLFTGVELGLLKKMKVTHHTQNAIGPFKDVIKHIFSNKRFMLYVYCSLTFHFGWQMGWPLFTIYTIKNLGANEYWLAIISISSLVTMFIGHIYWPRLIMKYGNATITAVCTVGMSITPILYIVSKNLYVLVVMAAIAGIVTSGTLTVLLSGVLEVIPRENRMLYMGVYTTFTNITLTIAPIVGHHLLTSKNIQFALVITALFRIIGGITFVIRDIYIKKTQTYL